MALDSLREQSERKLLITDEMEESKDIELAAIRNTRERLSGQQSNPTTETIPEEMKTGGTKPTILVIDGENVNILVMQALLMARGH